MMQLTDEQIKKAIEWWADRVCKPVFSGLSDEERKDPRNETYQFVEMITTTQVKPINDGQRQLFMDALEEELRDINDEWFYGLGVDYHPCCFLAAAAKKAGIPAGNFPWKTHMRFNEDGTVKAASGYGVPMEII